MGILSRPCVRRRAFELFHWSHELTHLALTVTTLWHATSAWQCVVRARVRASPYSDGELRTVARRYLLGGLVLWLVDHALRFSAVRRHVRVCSLDVEADGAVICLGYECDVPGAAAGAESEGPLAHAMGQFVFLQVPAIATVEWHPFSISSAPADMAPGDLLTTHHIRCVGDASFTGRLRALARSIDGDGDALASLVVNVDGPYGLPTEFERYDEILFVGGGIGVTPLHSSFRALYQLAKHNPAAMPCARVRLVWCARTPEIFELFAPTFHDAARDDLDGKFGVSLYCDMAPKDEFAESDALPFEHGRPDLAAHIAALAPRGMRALVFVCSVPPVAKLCSELTMKHGVDFHSETFFF